MRAATATGAGVALATASAGARREVAARVGAPPLPGAAARYHFFQAVRLLEARFPGAPRLGGAGPAAAERIRLRPSTSLAFPAADVESIRWRRGARAERAEVTACFFGLYGSTTPLPRAYAEQIRHEEREQPQLRDFLDIAHHRLLSLLYRGWLRRHYEQAYEAGGRDRLSRALLAAIGVLPETPPERIGIEPARLLRYLGLFLLPARPAAGLEALLGEELGVMLRVEECGAAWVALPRSEWFRLIAARDDGGGQLGRDVVIGARRLDRMGRVRVLVGPVEYPAMRRLAPGGADHGRLVALVRLYARRPLDIALDIDVPARAVPPLRVGGDDPGRPGVGACMGRPASDPVRFSFQVTARAGAGGRRR